MNYSIFDRFDVILDVFALLGDGFLLQACTSFATNERQWTGDGPVALEQSSRSTV